MSKKEFWIETFNDQSVLASNRLRYAYDEEQRRLGKDYDPDFDKRNLTHVIEMSAYLALEEKLRVAVKALENINSITKKQFEENPMYWATMANGASGEALTEIKGVY